DLYVTGVQTCALPICQIGLVLPGDQHVADVALDEGDGRAARAAVEHRHIAEDVAHEVARLLLRAVFLLRVAPGREIVPARAAGRSEERRVGKEGRSGG